MGRVAKTTLARTWRICVGTDSEGVRTRKEEFIDESIYQIFGNQCTEL